MEYFQAVVFKGTYDHRIDGKGRVPVPAEFRRALAEGGSAAVVVTLLDQCLAVYPPAEWQRLESQLRALPAFSRPVKALTRLLVSRAADCELDQQGRILLPAKLREDAGLREEAVIIGVLNRFEIWAPGRWSAFLGEAERLLEDAGLEVQWPLPPAEPGRRESGPGARRPQEKPSR